ncbi:MAG: terminase [Alphaproteobacteria bacterium]|nr:terminase [Alphaproteobacteria bacterium]
MIIQKQSITRHSYNGNSNLKKPGFVVQFEAEQIREIQRCILDPIYFIENYCYIVNLDHGLVKFKLYECQKEKVNTILNNRRVILMEGRQQGKTITSAACILWYTLFQESKTVAILANKAAAAREVLSRYQLMYENLPIWMQSGILEWNKGSVELENGSKIFCAATTSSGIRGKSVNWLYIDEAAIIPNNVAEEFFTSVYPTISSGQTTKILLTSTPLGYNHFWKFWNDAEQNLNGFVSMFIPYHRIPGRDEKWLAEQRATLGELKFNQEVLCEFLGSSNTLINATTLKQLSSKRPIFSKDGLDLYEEPSKNKTYMLVADVSRGVGGDYSAFSIIDVSQAPYTMVGKYRNNTISPILYSTVVYNAAKTYNNAYVLVEVNDVGQQVADIIRSEHEYENLLYVGSGKKGQFLSGGFTSAMPGVKTSTLVKRIGCASLKALMESKKLLIHDADTISEFSTFVEVRNTFKADEGYHDDLVMTLVLFAWAAVDPFFRDLTNTNIRQAMYEQQIQQMEEELTPFGFITGGHQEEVEKEVWGGDVWFTEQPKTAMAKMKKNWLENV